MDRLFQLSCTCGSKQSQGPALTHRGALLRRAAHPSSGSESRVQQQRGGRPARPPLEAALGHGCSGQAAALGFAVHVFPPHKTRDENQRRSGWRRELGGTAGGGRTRRGCWRLLGSDGVRVSTLKLVFNRTYVLYTFLYACCENFKSVQRKLKRPEDEGAEKK